MKKVVVIPDSFKGTMSSKEVGNIIRDEIAAVYQDAEILTFEVADGGEGSVDAFLSALGGEKIFQQVTGPYGEPVMGFYGISGDVAIIEMAAAAGLPLVGENRQAGKASTYGVGELINGALNHKIKKIIIALGGSASNDGGAGAACALGARFYDCNGSFFIPVGDTLKNIRNIDVTELDARLGGVEIIAMCDIDNPLLGEHGAAHIFGPQKGAGPEEVIRLDEGLGHYADMIRECMGVEVAELRGAGAAGGMGAGVVAFFNAKLNSGIETILDTIHFDRQITGSDMVITGEGRIDGQSARGKVVAGVAARAKKQNIPCIAVVGGIEDDAYQMYDLGVTAMFSILREAKPFAEIQEKSKENLRREMESLMRFYKVAKEK